MVDVLAGVLSGVGISSMLVATEGVGQLFGAIRIDGFRPLEHFTGLMDAAIREWRATPPVDSGTPVIVPGDPEWRMTEERRSSGIPIHTTIQADLVALAQAAGVRFPDPL
jgi:LDH2 family malate/lactate/ureidoglycolate dehydrogenase